MIRMSRSADRVKVTFALPLEGSAGRCSVVGDFNEWIPGSHELRKRANGTRSATVTVPRGTRLRFRYLGENGTCSTTPTWSTATARTTWWSSERVSQTPQTPVPPRVLRDLPHPVAWRHGRGGTIGPWTPT